MTFGRIAENDYTRAAKCRTKRALLRLANPIRCIRLTNATLLATMVLAVLFQWANNAGAQSPSAQSPAAPSRSAHQLFEALNALRVDPAAVYRIEAENRIRIRRGDATLAFDEGKLAFFVALDGQITGAVFSGRGHALAAPRDPVEKQQMARFLGATVLDEDFTSAYLRFTDSTPAELLDPLRSAKVVPRNDPEFAARWEVLIGELNVNQSLRMLDALLTHNPKPYFYAAVDGAVTGPFDVFYDLQRREPFLMGQPRRMEGQTTGAPYYDVWVSYGLPGDAVPAEAFRALNYVLDTTIDPSKSLEATTTVEIQATTGGERLVPFTLASSLAIDSITDERGAAIEYFQNEGLAALTHSDRGSDSLYVVLSQAPPEGATLRLRFHYRGTVIEDAGNGVLVVQARDSWYPHLGDTADFAPYELTMRWPHKLQLVATGRKLDEHLDGEYRVGRWRTDTPIPVAGFNLGEYASASVSEPAYSVDLYANHQLEQALSERLRATPEAQIFDPLGGRIADAERGRMPVDDFSAVSTPRPADALKAMGKDIAASIAFYEKFSGPFPFRSLSVSQIPGNFGQGWPGLLYLSTYAYLSPLAQRQAGLSVNGQEHFTQLVPFHEVAHQWWGNVVGWSSYRDQWIDEAMASYLSLMFADSRKPQEHELRVWLDRFRKSLLVKPATSGEEAAAETGALTLGSRLNSSKAPQDYEVLVYSKGSWVLHMLREMLRQPGAQDPDARFTLLLQTLAHKYAYRALSTADLQKEVEAVMTPSMDLEGGRSMEWFFDEWVRGTGVPHYHLEFTAGPALKGGFLVKGTLTQSGVPRSFIAPVPIYASVGVGRTVFLGTVTAEGNRTAFHFATSAAPHKLLVDPDMTLLCVSE